MFKRLFLSIIILSTLATEGGAYYSADFLDYYLMNLARLDIIQDSRIAVSDFNVQKSGMTAKRGTPVSFYRTLSQKAVEGKEYLRHNFFEPVLLTVLAALIFFTVSSFYLNIGKFFNTGRTLLSLADSSPPVFC